MNTRKNRIHQLFDYLNGNLGFGLEEIATPDFSYQTNLGSNYNLEDTIKNQEIMCFYVRCDLEEITNISGNNYSVTSKIEVIDISLDFCKTFPVTMNIKFEADMVKSLEINYITNPETIAVLKLLRERILNPKNAPEIKLRA